MKYLNFILILTVVCLIALSWVICSRPATGRYRFLIEEMTTTPAGDTFMIMDGHVIQDTATGKIYEWTDMITASTSELSRKHMLVVKDPVNDIVTKSIPKKILKKSGGER